MDNLPLTIFRSLLYTKREWHLFRLSRSEGVCTCGHYILWRLAKIIIKGIVASFCACWKMNPFSLRIKKNRKMVLWKWLRKMLWRIHSWNESTAYFRNSDPDPYFRFSHILPAKYNYKNFQQPIMDYPELNFLES